MTTTPPFNPGDWAAQIDTRQPVIGQIKCVYNLDGEWLIDLTVWSCNGEKLGRVSPPEGGPTRFEPACPASNYGKIRKPGFPLRRGLGGDYDLALKWLDENGSEKTKEI